MKISDLRRFFPLFFILGTTLAFSGLSIGFITRDLSNTSLILSLVGLGYLVFSACILFDSLQKLSALLRALKRSFIAFAALGFTVLFLLVNYLAVQYNYRFDLTRAHQHTLNSKTKEILQNLNQKIHITVFYVGVVPHYIEDLLSEFKRMAPQYISTKIVNPLVEIGYAAQYESVIKGNEKKVIIQSGKERKDVDFQEGFLTEEMLINNIFKVIRQQRIVYFLTGHSEYDIDDTSGIGLSKFKSFLEENNCLVKEITLQMQKEIPYDCDVLVIAGPQSPFEKEDSKLLQDYLEKGGKALFFIESSPVGTIDQPLTEEDKLKNPSLNEILNDWGVILGNDIVVDLESYIGGDVGCPATKNYPPHKEIVNGLDYTFYIRPRSIRIDPTLAPDVKIAPLVITSSRKNSWGETSKILHVEYNEGEDLPGPVMLGVIVWRPKKEGMHEDTKIIVFSDADFVTNNFIEQFSNAEIALNSVTWLSELDNAVVYQKKAMRIEQLNLTSKQLRMIIVVLISIPLLISCTGCLVWWKQTQ